MVGNKKIKKKLRKIREQKIKIKECQGLPAVPPGAAADETSRNNFSYQSLEVHGARIVHVLAAVCCNYLFSNRIDC